MKSIVKISVIIFAVVLAWVNISILSFDQSPEDGFLSAFVNKAYANKEEEKKEGDAPHACYKWVEDEDTGEISSVYCGDGNYCDGPGEDCDGEVACHDVCF